MSRRHLNVIPAVVVALTVALLVGCGDDSGGDDTGDGNASEQGAGAFADYDITGAWSGKLAQHGLPDFSVSARIRNLEDKFKNTVSYTGLDCSGHWAYQGREGAAFRFQEVIDAGKGGDCKGKGTVTLTPFAADGVDYNFSGGGVESAGVLRRTG